MTSDQTELSEPSALEPRRRRPGCPHCARAQVPRSLGSVQASGVWLWRVMEAQARGRTSPSLRGTGISASRTQSLRRRPSSAVSSRLVRTPPAPPARCACRFFQPRPWDGLVPTFSSGRPSWGTARPCPRADAGLAREAFPVRRGGQQREGSSSRLHGPTVLGVEVGECGAATRKAPRVPQTPLSGSFPNR